MSTRSTFEKVKASPTATGGSSSWFQGVCDSAERRRRSLLIVSAAALLFIVLVGWFNTRDQMLPYDRELTLALQGLATEGIASVMAAVSLFGYSPWNALLVGTCCVLVGWWVGWRSGLFTAILTLLQGLATVVLKVPIQQERPMETDLRAPIALIENSSFPSGHVTLYVVLLGFVVYLLYRYDAPRWLQTGASWSAFALVLFIGPSRILLGAHWVGDVVAAYLLGGMFLLIGIDRYEKMFCSGDPDEGGVRPAAGTRKEGI